MGSQIEQINDAIIKVEFSIGKDVKYIYIKLAAISSIITETQAVHVIKIFTAGQQIATLTYLKMDERESDLQKLLSLISK